MELYYDERDDAAHEARGSQILYWLDDLGAKPLAEARPDDPGFLFAGARPLDDYARLVARAWHDLAAAGPGMYGPVPQEVRVWVLDGEPYAWSFHHLNVLPDPAGFPPSRADLRLLAGLAGRVGSAFRSRCVAADFA